MPSLQHTFWRQFSLGHFMTQDQLAPPAPAPRSALVTVVAWLGVCVAPLALVYGLMNASVIAGVNGTWYGYANLTSANPAGAGAIRDLPFDRPAYLPTLLVPAVLFYLAKCVAWFVASIGLLKRRNWARLLVLLLLALGILAALRWLAWLQGMGAVLMDPRLLPQSPVENPDELMRGALKLLRFATAAAIAGFSFIFYRLTTLPVRAEFAPKSLN